MSSLGVLQFSGPPSCLAAEHGGGLEVSQAIDIGLPCLGW